MLKYLVKRTGLALLLAIFSVPGFCQSNDSAKQTRTQIFVKFIVSLDAAEPIYPSGLEHLIRQKPNCSDRSNGRVDCGSSELNIGGIRIKGIDFRSTPNYGSIFILTLLSSDCIPVTDFDKLFGDGFLSQSCMDGVPCVYRNYGRSWGLLSVRLGLGGCVKEIVLNTHPRDDNGG